MRFPPWGWWQEKPRPLPDFGVPGQNGFQVKERTVVYLDQPTADRFSAMEKGLDKLLQSHAALSDQLKYVAADALITNQRTLRMKLQLDGLDARLKGTGDALSVQIGAFRDDLLQISDGQRKDGWIHILSEQIKCLRESLIKPMRPARRKGKK